jgi:hypothetical protein
MAPMLGSWLFKRHGDVSLSLLHDFRVLKMDQFLDLQYNTSSMCIFNSHKGKKVWEL